VSSQLLVCFRGLRNRHIPTTFQHILSLYTLSIVTHCASTQPSSNGSPFALPVQCSADDRNDTTPPFCTHTHTHTHPPTPDNDTWSLALVYTRAAAWFIHWDTPHHQHWDTPWPGASPTRHQNRADVADCRGQRYRRGHSDEPAKWVRKCKIW